MLLLFLKKILETCCGLPVTSPLYFKARVGNLICLGGVLLLYDLFLTFRLFEGGTLEIFTDSEGNPTIDIGKK